MLCHILCIKRLLVRFENGTVINLSLWWNAIMLRWDGALLFMKRTKVQLFINQCITESERSHNSCLVTHGLPPKKHLVHLSVTLFFGIQFKNQTIVTEYIVTKKQYKGEESNDVLLEPAVCLLFSINFIQHMFITQYMMDTFDIKR